eukprot:CAMPEP_0117423106 /NCGR_PEP_ID=MMETSP0758-20121206/3809_1 /TAXON_ID=63605 /ORGANISM="Percolomonas cosmopolitus, Strain AE-1 (ATCC 50343)" /LENGTH=716 /DNA_ID=CAMNT_0005206121 /DNA_START=468 /DNA_END=2618 /DNA_ORIENTATION=+
MTEIENILAVENPDIVSATEMFKNTPIQSKIEKASIEWLIQSLEDEVFIGTEYPYSENTMMGEPLNGSIEIIQQQKRLFERLTFYFLVDERLNRRYEKLIGQYGGRVTKDINKPPTHILVKSILKTSDINHKSFNVVTLDWIDACIKAKKIIKEEVFYPYSIDYQNLVSESTLKSLHFSFYKSDDKTSMKKFQKVIDQLRRFPTFRLAKDLNSCDYIIKNPFSRDIRVPNTSKLIVSPIWVKTCLKQKILCPISKNLPFYFVPHWVNDNLNFFSLPTANIRISPSLKKIKYPLEFYLDTFYNLKLNNENANAKLCIVPTNTPYAFYGKPKSTKDFKEVSLNWILKSIEGRGLEEHSNFCIRPKIEFEEPVVQKKKRTSSMIDYFTICPKDILMEAIQLSHQKETVFASCSQEIFEEQPPVEKTPKPTITQITNRKHLEEAMNDIDFAIDTQKIDFVNATQPQISRYIFDDPPQRSSPTLSTFQTNPVTSQKIVMKSQLDDEIESRYAAARYDLKTRAEKDGYRFLLSNFANEVRKKLAHDIKQLGGTIVPDWSSDATHLIIPNTEISSLKYYASLACGIFILRRTFVDASFDAKQWQREEEYVFDPQFAPLPAFTHWKVYLLHSKTLYEAMASVYRAGGAEVIKVTEDDLDASFESPTDRTFLVYESSYEHTYRHLLSHFADCHIPCLDGSFLSQYLMSRRMEVVWKHCSRSFGLD